MTLIHIYSYFIQFILQNLGTFWICPYKTPLVSAYRAVPRPHCRRPDYFRFACLLVFLNTVGDSCGPARRLLRSNFRRRPRDDDSFDVYSSAETSRKVGQLCRQNPIFPNSHDLPILTASSTILKFICGSLA